MTDIANKLEALLTLKKECTDKLEKYNSEINKIINYAPVNANNWLDYVRDMKDVNFPVGEFKIKILSTVYIITRISYKSTENRDRKGKLISTNESLTLYGVEGDILNFFNVEYFLSTIFSKINCHNLVPFLMFLNDENREIRAKKKSDAFENYKACFKKAIRNVEEQYGLMVDKTDYIAPCNGWDNFDWNILNCFMEA